jgi:hypothetical protein
MLSMSNAHRLELERLNLDRNLLELELELELDLELDLTRAWTQPLARILTRTKPDPTRPDLNSTWPDPSTFTRACNEARPASTLISWIQT